MLIWQQKIAKNYVGDELLDEPENITKTGEYCSTLNLKDKDTGKIKKRRWWSQLEVRLSDEKKNA